MVKLVKHDLEFILKQIEIAEQHAAGTPLTDLVDSPLLPYGLRTVDGSYNNIVPGREQWGASGEPFPWMDENFVPNFRNEEDDEIVFGAGTPGETVMDNNDYGAPGNVIDADPRLISNLIVDQTLDNPAAITAALKYAGYDGQDLTQALTDIRQAHDIVEAIDPEQFPTVYAQVKADLDELLADHGIEMEGNTILLPNVAPDDGISASYNSWFTLFGQFFDHGLDLVKKGGNGTIYIPLQEDDPLYNPDTPHTNFMPVTRLTVGEEGGNVTTPWVDQNQTYTSNPSHQVFLREYAFSVDSDNDGVNDSHPVATGRMLDGEFGLPTWGDIKQQAREMLGIELTDLNVHAVPALAVDPYGEFIRGENGLPQLIVGVDGNGQLQLMEGDLETPVNPADVGAALTAHAFLDDIAHNAVPVVDANGQLVVDTDGEIAVGPRGQNTEYDADLLDAHYIVGDGRGNENVGLSAVHHIFHSEHNRLIDHVKQVVLESGDLDFINEWLATDLPAGAALPTDEAGIQALAETLVWDGERLFQAARFSTEMQYQHLVFEEFARKVQPDVDVFMVQPDVELNPAIFAEFAHVVYRFGHSMLNQSVDRINADGTRDDIDLFEAFLNPLEFGAADNVNHEEAAGAIIRGMTQQTGNEIDEFVTDVLRNQLLGIPLDLAAINLARGRDAGVPSLNEARAQFQEMAGGDTQLKPYDNWQDFALNLKNPASIVNFVAAYGTHATIVAAETLEEKRDAAFAIVMGGEGAPADRLAFLRGEGQYAENLGGLNFVDLWVGGLAEKKMSFGGMLGSTFSFVFEMQMENLQDSDRFYYLSRTQGLNLLTELENNSLAKIAMRNTDLGETGGLPGDIFSTPDHILYVDAARQAQMGHEDPVHSDPTLAAISDLVERRDGENFLRYNGADHIVVQGTDEDDTIVAGDGDDTVWGGAGNDRIEAGYGVDNINGGEGDDIITNNGTDIGEVDMLKGDAGNDVIHAGSGMALVFGGSGSDAAITGPDGSEVRAGLDDDFVLGGDGSDMLFGNEGDDWVEAGQRFDYIAGDNGELFFNSTIIGHDVLNGGQGDTDYDADSGDDIMFAGEGIQKFIGMWGHDWVVHKGQETGADADMNIEVFTTLPLEVLRDRYSQVEGASGWKHDDVLRGDDRETVTDPDAEEENGGAITDPTPETNFDYNELDQAGIDRIAGLGNIITEDLMRVVTYLADGSGDEKPAFVGGNILLGGGGSDLIEGRAGDDVIDGDKWLNVRIQVTPREGDAFEAFSVDSLEEIADRLVAGEINPGQLSIVREILDGGEAGDIDTAVYWDARENYALSVDALGRVKVQHVEFDQAATNPETGQKRMSDGTDTVTNVEVLAFADGDVNVITGTEANDIGGTRLDGGAGEDIIIGLGGDDLLRGFEGDDILDGGAGDDRLVGADGNDVLQGGDGDDVLLGNQGDDSLSGGAGADELTGGAGNDTLAGGAGDDVLAGNIGEDTFVWNAGDGRDVMNGGGGADTVVVTGDETAETFTVYDRATALSNGVSGLAAATEIVILRNGEVAAELDNIEEVVIDGAGGGDSFQTQGNFNGTSLSFSTITLQGTDGDDTVDISGLASSHRIVFRSAGGNDTIQGELREQDVIEFAEGVEMSGLRLVNNPNGSRTVTNGSQSVTFASMTLPMIALFGQEAFSAAELPLGEAEETPGGDTGDTPGETPGEETPGEETPGEETPGDTDPDASGLGTAEADMLVGTADADTLFALGGDDAVTAGEGDDLAFGGAGDDAIEAGGGSDMVFGDAGNDVIHGGEGNDTLYGGEGADTIVGGAGDDLIVGGAGDDQLFGGAGNDSFLAESGDGNDRYFGGEGEDTLDMSAVAADASVVLSASGMGSAQSSQSGLDQLSSIENVVTGSGDDTITASEAANVLTGGAGDDTFRFTSAAAADGDRITDFQPGDRIDLSAIDANQGVAGNQAFTLVTGEAFTGAGQLMVTYENGAEGPTTVISANTNGDNEADFRIVLNGTRELNDASFVA